VATAMCRGKPGIEQASHDARANSGALRAAGDDIRRNCVSNQRWQHPAVISGRPRFRVCARASRLGQKLESTPKPRSMASRSTRSRSHDPFAFMNKWQAECSTDRCSLEYESRGQPVLGQRPEWGRHGLDARGFRQQL